MGKKQAPQGKKKAPEKSGAGQKSGKRISR